MIAVYAVLKKLEGKIILAPTQITVLAILQGLTEFLPISSSGHLVLMPIVLGWKDQGLTIDIAVHIGTLGAVVLYLRRETWMILSGLGKIVVGKYDEGAKLAGLLLIASIPVFIAGIAVRVLIGDGIRIPSVIGWAFIIGGILLYISDRFGTRIRKTSGLTILDALLIGIAQAFAIIPGASRAGTTITMARLLGYERTDAARISLLMSIPAIAGAGSVLSLGIVNNGNPDFILNVFLGTIVAFITAILAISIMMNWIKRRSFTPFVVYRIALGFLILFLLS